MSHCSLGNEKKSSRQEKKPRRGDGGGGAGAPCRDKGRGGGRIEARARPSLYCLLAASGAAFKCGFLGYSFLISRLRERRESY